jgi:6-phosphogluconolactonase (cycloisomerase 2 family)
VFSSTAYAGRLLYAGDSTGNQIFALSIGSDGAAGLLGGMTLHFQSGPQGVAVDPGATTLYAALSNGVRPYAIGSSGGLTAGIAASAGTGPSAVALAPSGKNLYVANTGSNSVARYAVSLGGSLPASPSATVNTGDGSAPDGLAMTPDGRFIYVADSGTHAISGYSVDSVTGDLTELANSPFDVGSSTSAPAGLAVAPSGAFLYAALKGDNAMAGLSIDGATGDLSSLTGSPYAAGTAPAAVAVRSDGGLALVANSGGSVSRYTLTAGVPARLFSGGDPSVAGAQSLAIALDGTHAYVGGSSSVSSFDLSATGAMTARGIPQTTNGTHPGIALTPDQGPIAKMNPVPAPATTMSHFQGGPSIDNDGTVAKWSWDLGDGTKADGSSVDHAYASPGEYVVTLRVTDDEGCSETPVYTGQQMACVPSGFATWSQTIVIPPAPVNVVPDQECAHDGNDGFCGTPDKKAPQATILGISNGASISEIDAPTVIGGSITPDPSGIQKVTMRFTKAAGTIRGKKTVRKKVCRTRKVHGKKKRTCKRKKVTVRTKTKVPACQTVSGNRNYLVTYQCTKVPWITVPAANEQFRYDLPIALGLGTYTVQILATDGAGNSDVIDAGRNSVTFKIVNTPTNTGTGAGDTSGGTTTGTTTTPPPVNDTGSPF